jgi:hypothetical protein
MGLIARNPEHSQEQQASGQTVGDPPAHATGTVHIESVPGSALGNTAANTDANTAGNTDGGAHSGEVVRHTQRFEAGELVDWTLDSEPAPWALVLPADPTYRPGAGHADPAVVEAAGVRIGSERLVLPPLDDLPHPGFDELDFVPDATGRLRFELTGTPVGSILCDIHYLDGRRPWAQVVGEWSEDSEGPATDAPLIEVDMTFANYLRMRTGEKTALEAIADGGGVGETRWTLLLLLHGIVQKRRYMEIYRSLPVIPAEIGWWGEAAPFIPDSAAPA